MSWLIDQRQKAELEAHRERVRQVFARSFGAAMKSSEWVQALMYVEAAKDLQELQAVCRAFDVHWEKEGDMVTKNVKIDQLKQQIESLKAQVELLELGRMGKEPANGSVFKIEKRYQKYSAGYTFAAIKADGFWYLTGTGNDGTKRYTWEELKKFIGNYSRVWEMTSRKELVD